MGARTGRALDLFEPELERPYHLISFRRVFLKNSFFGASYYTRENFRHVLESLCSHFLCNRIGDPRNHISQKYLPRLHCAPHFMVLIVPRFSGSTAWQAPVLSENGPKGMILRIPVYLVICVSGQVSLENLLLSHENPLNQPTLSLSSQGPHSRIRKPPP